MVFIQKMQFVKKQHNIILKALILYNFGRPFLGHHSIHLVCLNHVPERSRICIFFFRNTSCTLIIPKLPPLGMQKGGGVKEFDKFLSPYPTNVTYQILSIFGPVFIEKIMLTDERRRMPTHSNRLHK